MYTKMRHRRVDLRRRRVRVELLLRQRVEPESAERRRKLDLDFNVHKSLQWQSDSDMWWSWCYGVISETVVEREYCKILIYLCNILVLRFVVHVGTSRSN